MKKKWRQVLIADTIWNAFLEVSYSDNERALYRLTVRQIHAKTRSVIVFEGWSVESARQTARLSTEAEHKRFFYAVNGSLSNADLLVEAVQCALKLSATDDSS